jgi:protocatechuate 3,4-dioxygenase beta subunit
VRRTARRQTGGPFYPTRRGESDADLTQLQGRTARATGEIIHVRGRVLAEDGTAISGAVVEVWQANAHGRYDHERDTNNPRPLDPNFQGRAELLTDQRGEYRFKTIKPGSYPAGGSWMRPPHIHFKVSRRGYHEVTTQMYFAGDPLNEKDGIRNTLTPAERDSVTVAFKPAPDDPAAKAGTFDITLRRVAA